MSAIPSLESWLTNTNRGIFATRSSELKAVDEALKKYWATAQPGRQRAGGDVSAAMARWIGKEGPTWRNNPRNAPPHRMVEQLYNALNTTVFTDADLEAFEFQDQERRDRMARIFYGMEIVSRFDMRLEMVRDAHIGKYMKAHRGQMPEMGRLRRWGTWLKARFEQGEEVAAAHKTEIAYGGLSTFSTAAKKFELAPAIRALFENLRPADMPWGTFTKIISEVVGESLEQAVNSLVEVVPFIGLGISAKKMLWSWGAMAKAFVEEDRAIENRGFIMPGGDIASAFAALERLLGRLTTRAVAKATIQTTSFTAKAAGTFLDLGIVTTAATTAATMLATMIEEVCQRLREERESEKANRVLRNTPYDTDMFNDYPLLGCYMLLLSDTSDIINMVRAGQKRRGAVQFGSLGWKEEVEWIKRKHIDPILQNAAAIVATAGYVLKSRLSGRYLLNREGGTRLTTWRAIHQAHKENIEQYYSTDYQGSVRPSGGGGDGGVGTQISSVMA
jgi:hypothetical protein